MPTPEKKYNDGPSQHLPAPEALTGFVVDWHDGGAIHGYGVLDDLARHYAPHEVFLLGQTGAPPSVEHGRAFGVALSWLSAAHVGLAATHSTVLARVSGSPTSGIISIAATVAAREAEYVITQHQSLVDWLSTSPRGPFDAWDDRQELWRRRLADACELDVPELELARDEATAALIVFHVVGLRQRRRLVAAWAWARMIGALAESLADEGLDLRTYPLRLPPFDYVEGT